MSCTAWLRSAVQVSCSSALLSLFASSATRFKQSSLTVTNRQLTRYARDLCLVWSKLPEGSSKKPTPERQRVELPTPSHARRVEREERYKMVWAKPLTRLAAEFGITGNGLAKVCDRLDVPYPPRCCWSKKEAGKPVVTLKLPPQRDGIPSTADIHPTPTKPAPTPAEKQAAEAVADRIREIAVPESNDHLHPSVQAWIAGHKKRQKERELENRNHRRDFGWASLAARSRNRQLRAR
jgi:hypothetical protein